MIGPDLFFRSALALSSMGAVLANSELLSLSSHLRNDGLLGWRAAGTRRGVYRTTLALLFAHHGVIALIVMRLAAAVAVLFCACSGLPLAASLTAYVFVDSLLSRRPGLGNNGSDCMFHVTMVACWIGVWGGREGEALCLFFLTAQLTLAYLTSGLVKIGRRGWHDGTYLREIAETRAFGSGLVARFLGRYNWVCAVVSQTVVLGEPCVACAPFVPARYTVLLLLCAGLFHCMTAAVMGLNTFVPAFVALFPPCLYVALRLYGW